MSLTVWQIDAVHLTPYYDMAVCNALAQAGYTVRFITSRFLYERDLLQSKSYRTDYLYFHGLNQPCLLRFPLLRRTLRTLSYPLGHHQLLMHLDVNPPDVVHFQWSRIPQLDIHLIARLRKLGIPIVHTVHDVTPLFDHAYTAKLVNLYSLADRLIVHTETNRRALLELYPILHTERIRVVPHIALKNSPGNTDCVAARQILGIPVDAPVLLFLGTIRPYKGLDTLVEAYFQARRTRPDLWLIVAGLPESSRDAERLTRLSGQIIVNMTYLTTDQVGVYHAAADLAVFPYRQISQSGALITAMGYGLPVIVSAVGGLPETVDMNGWVVPPDDPPALARTVIEAFRNRTCLQQMGQRSLQLIDECHSPSLVARETIHIYKEIVECGASSSVLIV